MGRGRNCYKATFGNDGFVLLCSLFLAGYLVRGATSYDYSATIQCQKQPLDPQYGGGLIANPGFDKGIKAWKKDGHVKLETRESGGNKFIVAYNRTTPYSVSQSFYLKEGLFYAFSAWVQLSEGSDTVVAMIYDSDHKTVTTVGSVIAKSGCWSMLKGGLTVDHSAPSVLHLQSNNTKSELMVDSVSLKEFTKHEWQEHRLKNIEKVRKRVLRVNVSNKDGNKIRGAKIKIQQRKLQFVIGCATPSSILMSESYQKWFVSRFTTAVFDNEMKWYYVEGLQGQENYSTPDAMLKFFEDHGIDVRGHNILWGADNIQRWLRDLPPRQLLSESVRRIGSIMSRYAGKLVAWDVVNENLHHPLFEARLGKNASAIFYKIASSLDSRATMFLNEFNTLEHPGDMVSIPSKYIEKLQEIKAFPGNEELVIGIGLQGHFDNHPNIPYVRAVFDVLGETKMPIWLTELNVKPCSNQAYYLEEIMREAFAHPAVKGMMIWIGWKPDRCNEMCLLNYKLQSSPSGDVVDKLLAEWKTTNLKGVTDEEGSFEVKVFHGDYDVTLHNPKTGANVTKKVQTLSNHDKGQISFFWSWSYWSTFSLTWVVVPILQGYEDAGDFTITERLKSSAHANLVFYLCIGVMGLFGLVLLIVVQEYRIGNIPGFAMACSNTFGLVTGAFLLGFGLSEIPKGIWRSADWTTNQKILSHKVAKMAVKLDDAHQEFSNAIVVAQATSKQMSRRDPLRPYMNVIDKMLSQMLSEDPAFKPQGGNLGENDMDYDTDAKTMAALRRQLEIAREKYYRYRSEYMNFVTQALELEDTIKNFEHRSGTGWKYISSFRPERSGRLGSILDITELIWRCVLAKQLQKVLAIVLGCMSASILLAEATILPSGVDLSLFSILINAMKEHEMLVQVAAFIPLMYMCMCTYYSLFKIGMFTFYSLTPRQTSSVSLLMICSMVARYAPPISYNFLNLIHLDNGAKTIFEKRMGNIDDAVPFFGRSFNKIYPLIMVVYTLLIASNFFGRVLSYFGNWKIFKFLTEESDDLDGFDPSGLIILQKERSWLEQGHKVGELVVPLARNFQNASLDLESGSNNMLHETKPSTRLREEDNISHSKPLKGETQHESSKEEINGKYKSKRARQMKRENSVTSNGRSRDRPLSRDENSMMDLQVQPSRDLSSTWRSMQTGFRNFKSNMESKGFIPLNQVQDAGHSRASSTDSLDEIFDKIKRPASESPNYDSDDDAYEGLKTSRPGR